MYVKCNSVVNILVMGLVLGLSLMVIIMSVLLYYAGLLLYTQSKTFERMSAHCAIIQSLGVCEVAYTYLLGV